jgi:hypothetical protein
MYKFDIKPENSDDSQKLCFMTRQSIYNPTLRVATGRQQTGTGRRMQFTLSEPI